MVSKSDTEWDGTEGLCGQQYDLSTCHHYNVPSGNLFDEKISMAHIFYLVAGITMVSVIVESRIHEEKEEAQDDYTWKQYCQDIREGFHYLKKEKGIRNIYTL